MTLRLPSLLLALLLLAACQTTQGAGGTAAAKPSFEQWQAGLRAEALQKGVSGATFERAFAGVRVNAEVLENEATQPEVTRQVWDYLARAVSDQRIADGRQRLAENRPLLDAVGRQYGVPPATIVAIWGMESAYGANTGSFNVIEALATLAYGSGRGQFFRDHLIDALLILEAGDIPPERMLGSWAGAMGQTQFMPTAFRERAVDYDRNGRRDIWGSLPDVFGSTANYLASFGWRAGEGWGAEVRLPAGFAWEQAELDIRKPVGEWQQQGVRRIDGGALPASAGTASILLPGGHRGPAFIVLDNFRVILKYNFSTSYALAVGHLGDRVAGGGPIAGGWPTELQALSRTQKIELQTLLTARGYDTGGVDGAVGPKTRAALRRFQQEIGEPADGFATIPLLDRLRALMTTS